MSYVHIYAPPVVEQRIVRTTCLDCKKPTRMLCFFQEWHGWHSTCIRCGRHWDDGEWIALPFARNARRESIEGAKRRWRRVRDSRLKPLVETAGGLDAKHESDGAGTAIAQTPPIPSSTKARRDG